MMAGPESTPKNENRKLLLEYVYCIQWPFWRQYPRLSIFGKRNNIIISSVILETFIRFAISNICFTSILFLRSPFISINCHQIKKQYVVDKPVKPIIALISLINNKDQSKYSKAIFLFWILFFPFLYNIKDDLAVASYFNHALSGILVAKGIFIVDICFICANRKLNSF